MPIRILDAHCHCGRQDLDPPQDYETIAALHRAAGVEATWMFPPVYEVYDRYDPAWQARRTRAGDYLLGLALPPADEALVLAGNALRLIGETAGC